MPDRPKVRRGEMPASALPSGRRHWCWSGIPGAIRSTEAWHGSDVGTGLVLAMAWVFVRGRSHRGCRSASGPGPTELGARRSSSSTISMWDPARPPHGFSSARAAGEALACSCGAPEDRRGRRRYGWTQAGSGGRRPDGHPRSRHWRCASALRLVRVPGTFSMKSPPGAGRDQSGCSARPPNFRNLHCAR